ncbi:hypothetical protein FOZ60_004590 [Perkinsus olseni]|uniref:Box C/D snoRNA protein 1 n=1 Tax=Perkinsus olseni TaxID=32597 RepID=A0A7J6PJ04_PEROL|nr:hypothetical protein FOZ60_004590 [Perkinsus olseni]
MSSPGETSASSASLCQVCKKNDFKYTCPACSMRTCSLECVNAHKATTKCTGKRALVEHVAINEFDEKVLRRDISLLEDASCKAHTAQTHALETRNDSAKPDEPNPEASVKEGSEQAPPTAPDGTPQPDRTAETPGDSTKAAMEESPPAQDPVVQSSEEAKLGDMIEALVSNKWRRDLSTTIPDYITAGPEKVSVFMKVLMSHKPHTYHDESPYNNTEQDLSRCNKFWSLDLTKSIKENLHFRVVVEHPVFIVTLEPSKYPVMVETEQPIVEVAEETPPAPEPSMQEAGLADDLPPPAPTPGKGSWHQHSRKGGKGGKGHSGPGKGQWTGQYTGSGEWRDYSGDNGWWNAGKGGGKGSESWSWGPQYPPSQNEWQGGSWTSGWGTGADSWSPSGKGTKGGDWGKGKGGYYNSGKGGRDTKLEEDFSVAVVAASYRGVIQANTEMALVWSTFVSECYFPGSIN